MTKFKFVEVDDLSKVIYNTDTLEEATKFVIYHRYDEKYSINFYYGETITINVIHGEKIQELLSKDESGEIRNFITCKYLGCPNMHGCTHAYFDFETTMKNIKNALFAFSNEKDTYSGYYHYSLFVITKSEFELMNSLDESLGFNPEKFILKNVFFTNREKNHMIHTSYDKYMNGTINDVEFDIIKKIAEGNNFRRSEEVKNAYWLASMHISTEIFIIDLYGQDQWTQKELISCIKNRIIGQFINYSHVAINSHFGIKTKLIFIGPEEVLQKSKFIYNDCIVETINYDTELKIPNNSALYFDKDYIFMLQKACEYDENYKFIFDLVIKKCKIIGFSERGFSERRNRRSFIDPKNHFDNLKLSKYYSVVHDDDDWNRGEYSILSRSITLVRK